MRGDIMNIDDLLAKVKYKPDTKSHLIPDEDIFHVFPKIHKPYLQLLFC